MGRRVFLTGGTGFVGSALVDALQQRGDEVVAVTRSAARLPQRPGITAVEGDCTREGEWQNAVAGCAAIVNLAGHPIAAQRWNAQFRQLLHDSRVDTTRFVVEAIRALHPGRRPSVLVNASGVDYYPFAVDLGNSALAMTADDEVDESCPNGSSALARICRDWESEAALAEREGLRVVLLRLGVVLGDGGALDKIKTPFARYIGGRLGHGRQWFSWVHLSDVVAAILFAMDRDDLAGPVNVVAKGAVRNREFAQALGEAMNRPAWLPVPAFALEAAVGGFAEYLLNGRRVVPRALERAGFSFEYPEIRPALASIFR